MKKWQKIASLILSLLLLLPMCLMASAEEAEPTTPEAPGFHAATVRRLIHANLETASVDEEFYHLLANAYLADPALLTATIADLPQEDITYLAKAIAYDLQKTGREEQAEIPADCATPMQTIIARLICLEADNTANANLESLTPPGGISMSDIIVSPDVEPLVDEEVTGTITLSKDSADVGDSITASVAINTNLVSSSNRIYQITLCMVISNGYSVRARGLVYVSSGALSGTGLLRFNLNSTGVQQYYVQITNSTGTLLGETSRDSITSMGTWQIDICFTEDRDYVGTIALYDGNGFAVDNENVCLGKSASNLPMTEENGDTPIGVYEGELAGYRSDTDAYGPHQVIAIEGIYGYVVDACSHRDLLRIHGGRDGENNDPNDPSYPLKPTNGCVRVTNEYQRFLEEAITLLVSNCHYAKGIVTIMQDGLTTLPDA